MGIIVNLNEFKNLNSNILQSKLIVLKESYLIRCPTVKKYNEFSLGSKLAERLIKYPSLQRKNNIVFELDRILKPDNINEIAIKDIDILFNPEYKLDVLKYFCNLARTKKIVLVWNGIIEDVYLQYSENGYVDYKKFKIEDYDIVCIR